MTSPPQPEHDPANWHLRRVGMKDTEIVVNLALTLFTCFAWLPFFALWFVLAWNRQGWVYAPAGSAPPRQSSLAAWYARLTVGQTFALVVAAGVGGLIMLTVAITMLVPD